VLRGDAPLAAAERACARFSSSCRMMSCTCYSPLDVDNSCAAAAVGVSVPASTSRSTSGKRVAHPVVVAEALAQAGIDEMPRPRKRLPRSLLRSSPDARARRGTRHGRPQLLDTVAVQRARAQHHRRPALRAGAAASARLPSASSRVRPRGFEVALVVDDDVGELDHAFFIACRSSPACGSCISTKTSVRLRHVRLAMPTPTVSTITTSKPAASTNSIASRRVRGHAARARRTRRRRMNAWLVARELFMRVLSPSTDRR
jgi:hypothetical protein